MYVYVAVEKDAVPLDCCDDCPVQFQVPRVCCNQGRSILSSISYVSILTHQVPELFV